MSASLIDLSPVIISPFDSSLDLQASCSCGDLNGRGSGGDCLCGTDTGGGGGVAK